MRGWSIVRQVGFGGTLMALLLASPGCTYLRNRGRDAADMADIGVTWTKSPQWSFYVCAAGLASAGAGRIDGKFAGIGGGKVAVQRHYEKTLGLVLWSYEELGWGEFDVAKQETLVSQHVGLLGWINHFPRRPDYAPGCIHCVHLGYGGFIANLRYMQMIDFLLGWFGLDVCGDDGRKFGHWPWQDETARNLPDRPNLGF